LVGVGFKFFPSYFKLIQKGPSDWKKFDYILTVDPTQMKKKLKLDSNLSMYNTKNTKKWIKHKFKMTE